MFSTSYCDEEKEVNEVMPLFLRLLRFIRTRRTTEKPRRGLCGLDGNKKCRTTESRNAPDPAARSRKPARAPPPRSWPSSPRAAAPRGACHRGRGSLLAARTPRRLRLPGTPLGEKAESHPRARGRRAARRPGARGPAACSLRIRLPDRTLTADIAAKSLRKAQTAIRNAGGDNVALVLQGRLTAHCRSRPLRAAKGDKGAASPMTHP